MARLKYSKRRRRRIKASWWCQYVRSAAPSPGAWPVVGKAALIIVLSLCTIRIQPSRGFALLALPSTSTSTLPLHIHPPLANRLKLQFASGPLFSTLFFGDDDDIDWDEDDDDDLNFDFQYEGRALVDGGSSSSNDESTDGGDDDDDEEEIEDDTDESYYDQLFRQQSSLLSSSSNDKHDVDVDIDIDIDIDGNNLAKENSKEQASSLSIDDDQEDDSRSRSIEGAIRKAEEYHRSMQQLHQDFLQRQVISQYQSKMKRKQYRVTERRRRMEERATLLALRALRQESISRTMYYPLTSATSPASAAAVIVSQPQSSSSSSSSLEATFSTTTKNISSSSTTSMGQAVSTLIPNKQPKLKSMPSPTLSYSSTRNYKRANDFIIDNMKYKYSSYNHSNSNSNNNNYSLSLKIEQKIYGNRFKHIYNVYLRLLQTLDEMKVEYRKRVDDYLSDKIERSVEMQMALSIDGTSIGVTVSAGSGGGSGSVLPTTSNLQQRMLSKSPPPQSSSSSSMNYDIDESIEMNKNHQERMNIITALSLYELSSSSSYSSSSSSSSSSFSTTKQMQENIKKEIHNKLKYDLEMIDSRDLISVLRIRGNTKRRGRLPKSRQKVLEQLTISLANTLFE